MKSPKRIFILVICIIAFIILLAGAIFSYSLRASAVDKEFTVYVPTATDYDGLIELLKAGGGVKRMGRFEMVAKFYGLDKEVRPGRYIISTGKSYITLVKMFKRGLQTPVRVTFNNIRLLEQLAGKVGGQIEPDSLELARHLADPEVAASYGFNPQTFISMFIPDTYELYWTTTPEGFTDRMHREFDKFWNQERLEKAAAHGLTPVEVITLASIVYEETKMSDEMPTVAGVYLNRIRKGWKLEADPTVKFGIGDFGLRRVMNRHLKIDTPYNTYIHAGIPPGPICMPSVTAIEAVLNPAQHDYMFFCARADFSGYHSFAVTNAEHNRNRAAWTAALNMRGIR